MRAEQEERKEKPTERELRRFRKLYLELRGSYEESEIVRRLKGRGSIPVDIFSKNLSPLETVVKHLRDIGMSNKAIAGSLNRSDKTISQAYNSARRKHPQALGQRRPAHCIPIEALSDRRYSILESLAAYLKDTLKMKFVQIARELGRDQRTIWTVYSRAKKK